MTTTETGDGGTIHVRPVVQADLLAVFRIEKAAFEQPWPFSAFERCLDAPAFLVAEESGGVGGAGTGGGPSAGPGAIVGYVVGDLMANHGRPLGHVKDIAVRPDRQGEGVGSTLLEQALATLAAEGVSSVKLEVRPSNEGALAMYREFGFEPVKRVPRYYADGEDALVLVREFGDGTWG